MCKDLALDANWSDTSSSTLRTNVLAKVKSSIPAIDQPLIDTLLTTWTNKYNTFSDADKTSFRSTYKMTNDAQF